MAEIEEELKDLLMRVRVEWTNWLESQHSKDYDHLSSLITLCKIEGGEAERGRFSFLGLQNYCRQ